MATSYQVVIEQEQPVVDALAQHTGLSKQRIKDAMNKGACWCTQKGKQLRLRRASKVLPKGTRLALHYDERLLALQPLDAQLIEDAGRYSVWHKPHGMLAQGSQWGDHCALLRSAELTLKRPCFLVHRLDADAAGLMLVAHDPQAAAALSRLFQERLVNKLYWAWVAGNWQVNGLRLDAELDGKPSVSWVDTVRTVEPGDLVGNAIRYPAGITLVQVRIETGRKHQIRRHLAGCGQPILGDRLYGGQSGLPLQLLAWQLGFDCPIRKRPVVWQLAEALLPAPVIAAA